MTASDHLSADELMIRMQERIAELEKANQVLHAEILEHKQEKHRINRYNNVLEGINRIFGSIVKAETKEELTIACLSVAIDVTGSQIGFVGEMGADRLMHDVAINNSGWDQCLMHDKTGHHRRLGNFILHGLYDRVIDSGKGFFTNDPSSYPDSIGFPDGHPPLRSFLGVPLILDGKTIGILGVANRESGYSFEQQEDLEAIASAAVQVLQRKREEQERERVEEALRESRTKLEAALASMTDAVFISDAHGRFIDFNDAFAVFHRFRNKEECSKTFAEYPDILDVFMADGTPAPVEMWAVPRALRGETVTDVEYILRRKDTGETWVGSYSFAPIRNKDGAIVGSVVIGRDITERKQAEETLSEAYEELQMQSEELQAQTEELQEAYEALSESEKRYRLLFNSSMDAIILTDPRNGEKILSANPAACHMLGWSEKELIGKGRDVMFDLADPALSILLDERARSGSAKAQLTYRRKDGTTFPGEVSTAFFTGNNEEPRTVAIIRDITERKQAEEALSRERSLLESVMRATDFMLVFLDPQFNFMWVNPAYAESCQMKPEEMVGKNHFALYPQAENEAIFRKVRDTGEGIFYKDKSFVYPDQPERGVTYWDWSLAPVKNSCGNVTGLVLSLRETTKYKRAEEALRKSEERYRMLFTNMTEGFVLSEVIYNNDGKPCDYRYLELNPAYELQTGIKKENVLGKSALEVFSNPSPIQMEKLGEVALSGKSTHFEIFSGVMNKHFEIDVFSPEKGKVAAISRDISEKKEAEIKLKETLDNLENLVRERTAELEKAYNSLKESEGRLKALFKLLPVGVSITDKERNILDVNLALESILGLSRSDLLKGKQATRKYLRSDGTEMSFEEFPSVRALKEEGSIQSSEMRIIKEDGSIIWTDVSAIALPFSDGQVVITTRDITERKQAEEALAKIDIARQKEIHHRIKNNLQVISSLLDLQAEKFNNRKCIKDSEVLEAFRESQDRVISIALIHEELHEGGRNDALNFSLYLQRLAESLFQTYRLGNPDISLRLDLEENVLFDMDIAVPLGMIVNELITNSLKYAFPGRDKGTIQIKLFSQKTGNEPNNKEELTKAGLAGKGAEYTLIVSDNGIGVPGKIDFANPDTLGLQLVAVLVDQLDGEIELKRDIGTEFKIRINVQQSRLELT
ncbi:MAG: PAS domain S-box protein [Methanosarcina sp.]